jgi:uncharacterized protein (DUF1501 family)
MSVDRREFLRRSLTASAVFSWSPALPAFLQRTLQAAASDPAAGTILVAIQLAGGNDGLNTVVPFADDHYARNRPTIRLRESQLYKIDSHLGFAPQLKAFKGLFDEGLLSVVQGVGYPNSNRNHDAAMRIWQTGRPKATDASLGWLGQVVDQAYRPEEGNVPGVFVGQLELPTAMHARRMVVPRLNSPAQFTLRPQGEAGTAHREQLAQLAALPRNDADNPYLKLLTRGTVAACAASARVEAVVQGASSAGYPSLQLAERLRTIAQLIRAELGIRIFYTELGGPEPGGFDNHANQLANHGVLLEELAESVAAFAHDLRRDGLLDRVVLLTFSEFGRSLAENGRHGTDHGAAAPMFLVGGKLRGGLVGPHPDLADLDAGAPRFHTDFRQVYATVVERWLKLDSRAVLGQAFSPVDLFQAG